MKSILTSYTLTVNENIYIIPFTMDQSHPIYGHSLCGGMDKKYSFMSSWSHIKPPGVSLSNDSSGHAAGNTYATDFTRENLQLNDHCDIYLHSMLSS